jgi:hypothetical protein
MTTIRTMMSISIAATLLLAGLTTGVQALGPGGGGLPSFGGELRGMTQVTGSVVCVGCSLNEVRAAQPELQRLYQLNHQHGQLVMTVKSVNEAARWESIVGLSHQISARAPASLFRQLTAEENLFKEVVILGLLRRNRTLDIGEITIDDPNSELLSSSASQ